MTRFLYKLSILLVAGTVLLTACKKTKSIPTVDIQKQVTQTMQAVAKDVQPTLAAVIPTIIPPTNTPRPTAILLPTATPLPTATLLPTATPLPAATLMPTETLAPTQTPMPVVTETSVSTDLPSLPTAHINKNTNCRSGPSTIFPIVFIALEGEELRIVSNTTVSDYVIAENPSNPGQTCWLWTQYVDISGDLSGLLVATPPPVPTPTVNFKLTYYRVETCTGWSLAFKIVNTGLTTLQSYTIVAKDLTENTQETTSLNNFNQRDGCGVKEYIPYLDSGESGFIYADDFAYDPDNHSINTTITVCSNDNQKSVCGVQVINFTP
jgi:hypothetical protein